MATHVSRVVTVANQAQERRHTAPIFIFGDIFALTLAFLIATAATGQMRSILFGVQPSEFYGDALIRRTIQLYVLGLGVCLWLAAKGHYTARHPLNVEAKQILLCVMVISVIDGYLQFALREQPSRIWLASTWILAFPLLLLIRFGLKYLLFQSGRWRCPTLIIGSERTIRDVASAIDRNPYLGHVVIARINVGEPSAIVARLDRLISSGACEHVLVAFDETNVRETLDVLRTVEDHFDVPLSIVPLLRDLSISHLNLQSFFGHDLIFLSRNRRTQRRGIPKVKRAFDLLAATLILILASPLLALVAILVSLDGHSPIYRSPRIGRHNKIFHAYKFRSMIPNAGKALEAILERNEALRMEWEQNFKLERDPRITRVGRIIRRTSIDELPQLFNILKGEMSLVGPRPLLLEERTLYTGRAFDLYGLVTPGLTGMWQVSGRNDLEYIRRIELNNWYIKNWSPWVDIVILFRTCFVVIRGTGAS